jgi:AcrR family transcriptional regulator
MPKTKDQNRLARERIVAALTALMSEKDYASITITEITQKADVSRMTYYRNYSSKEDILRKFMSDVGERIHAKIVEHDLHRDVYRYYLTLFETLGKYAALVNAALAAGLDGLILDCIARNMDQTFLEASAQPNAEKYLLRYRAGAFFHVFIEWTRSGMQESCEQMARLCADAAMGKLYFHFPSDQ